MINIDWENINYLWWILLIPLVIYAFIQLKNWRKRAKQQFADNHLINEVFSHSTDRFFWFKNALLILSILCFIVALIAPMFGEEQQTLKREGMDMVIALDLSNSMNTEDIAPNRLSKSKMFIQNLLAEFSGERVGLVVFAGDAYPISPLTSDYNALNSYLETVTPYLFWNQGTNMGDAIKESLNLLGTNQETSRAIILISDGEDHEEGIEKFLDQAKDQNVKIFSIGVGGNTPSPIPIYENGIMNYKEDQNGETVLSQLEERELKRIADNSNGAYIRMSSVEETVNQLQNQLSGLKKKSQSETTTMSLKNRFQYPLAVGLVLLFMFTLTSEQRFFNS